MGLGIQKAFRRVEFVLATRLADGSIRLSDGRIVYADSVLQAADLVEIVPLLVPPPAWPFVSGGGGGGAASSDGEDGAQGNQGPSGAAGGAQGAQGRQGLQGPQGNQGSQGASEAGTQGPQGVQGPQGAQGPQGFQGPQGVQGPQGNQGRQGVQGPQGNQGWQGDTAASLQGQYAQNIEVLYSEVASSTYVTSTFRYLPIAKVASPAEQYIQAQFRATRSGRLWLKISYAMSVSNGGDVLIQQYQTAVADTESVDAALTTGALTTLTPGTGATRKTLTLDTGFDVVDGDDVIMRLTRDDGAGDTHTGSMNFIDVLATVV